MIRWKYIVPRMAILALLLGCTWLALNPLLRWSLIQIGQSAIGARVEISRLSTILSRAELNLSNLAIADPEAPMRNLVEADSASFDIDTAQLLRRRLIIDEGQVRGLRLHTDRATSGAIRGNTAQSGTGLAERMTGLGELWLDSAASTLGKKIEGDLRSVELSRELIQRWPAEYQRLESEVKSLRERGKALIVDIKRTRENPIQPIEHYHQLLGNVDALRQDTVATRQKFNRVAERMRLDRTAIEQAKQHDVQYVKQHLQIAKLDPEAISRYLLGPEMGPKVSQLVQWIKWGRSQMPTGQSPKVVETRGWNVVLPGMQAAPSLLVRNLSIDGQGSASGQPFSFEGTVEGFTNQPSLYGKPATVLVKSAGAIDMTIHATLDHTADSSRDRLVIECPRMAQPSRLLGGADKLAVQVGPGNAAMSIVLDLAADKLDGIVRFQQPQVDLQPIVAERMGGQTVAERLSLATSAVRDLRADLRIGGTLDQPKWNLTSNLGSQLATGLTGAVEAELRHRQETLLAVANQEIDQQLDELDRRWIAKRNELLAELDLDSQELNVLKKQLADLNFTDGVADKLIGENGVLNKLFRR